MSKHMAESETCIHSRVCRFRFVSDPDCDGRSTPGSKRCESFLSRANIKSFDKLREHLQARKKTFEENYPIGHDQRDATRCHIVEIDQTLIALDLIESLGGGKE